MIVQAVAVVVLLTAVLLLKAPAQHERRSWVAGVAGDELLVCKVFRDSKGINMGSKLQECQRQYDALAQSIKNSDSSEHGVVDQLSARVAELEIDLRIEREKLKIKENRIEALLQNLAEKEAEIETAMEEVQNGFLKVWNDHLRRVMGAALELNGMTGIILAIAVSTTGKTRIALLRKASDYLAGAISGLNMENARWKQGLLTVGIEQNGDIVSNRIAINILDAITRFYSGKDKGEEILSIINKSDPLEALLTYRLNKITKPGVEKSLVIDRLYEKAKPFSMAEKNFAEICQELFRFYDTKENKEGLTGEESAEYKQLMSWSDPEDSLYRMFNRRSNLLG